MGIEYKIKRFDNVKDSLVGKILAYGLAGSLALGGVSGLIGCKSKEELLDESIKREENLVKEVIKKHFECFNKKDVYCFMDTVYLGTLVPREAVERSAKKLINFCEGSEVIFDIKSIKLDKGYIKEDLYANVAVEVDIDLICKKFGFIYTPNIPGVSHLPVIEQYPVQGRFEWDFLLVKYGVFGAWEISWSGSDIWEQN